MHLTNKGDVDGISGARVLDAQGGDARRDRNDDELNEGPAAQAVDIASPRVPEPVAFSCHQRLRRPRVRASEPRMPTTHRRGSSIRT